MTLRTLPAHTLLCVFSATALLCCGDTGRAHLEIPAFAVGTKARAVEIEGARVRLTKAVIAFGPLYLCATESAESELCSTGLAELLTTALVDGLSTRKQPLGALEATSGSVRSGFFDYGISWGLTRQTPRATDGGNGHSARLEGTIEIDGGEVLNFHADIDITPLSAGDAAVNGLKTRRDIGQDTRTLLVVFDPNAWLANVKLERLLELEDEEGEIKLVRGSQPYEAILQGMTVNTPPALLWE